MALSYFTFNGESSADYGLIIQSRPSFSAAERNVERVEIPGRNGAFIVDDGTFKEVSGSYSVWLRYPYVNTGSKVAAAADLREEFRIIASWLCSPSGYAELTDTYDTAVSRLATYSGGLTFSSVFDEYGAGSLEFTCRPEKFLTAGLTAIDFSSTRTQTVNNPTLFNAKPLIKYQGSGTIKIGDITLTIAASSTASDEIYIDCETCNAYMISSNKRVYVSGSTYLNSLITLTSGEFPYLTPGNNSVVVSSGFTALELTPRYWTL